MARQINIQFDNEHNYIRITLINNKLQIEEGFSYIVQNQVKHGKKVVEIHKDFEQPMFERLATFFKNVAFFEDQ